MRAGVDIGKARSIEWPTILVAFAIYASFGLLTWFHEAIPIVLLVLAGGYVVAWHGSLQHEAVHGHPTRWSLVNRMLVFPSLWLWIPYEVYREQHLRHHRDPYLTDPVEDPESFYVTPAQWETLSPFGKALRRVNNSLLGRLLLCPLLCVWSLYAALFREGPKAVGSPRIWAVHLLSVALVLTWVVAVCGMPLWVYLLCFAYPGMALTSLRSFLEHRAADDPAERTAIVEAEAPLALMFLNNNLHVVHHEAPWLPWYAIPRRYREQRDRILADNGGYFFRGYWEVALRYLLRPKEPVVHPQRQAA